MKILEDIACFVLLLAVIMLLLFIQPATAGQPVRAFFTEKEFQLGDSKVCMYSAVLGNGVKMSSIPHVVKLDRQCPLMITVDSETGELYRE